jgi:hypothetical protein
MIFVCRVFYKVFTVRLSLLCLCTTLSITNPTWAGLGLNLGLSGGSSGSDMYSIDTLSQCKNYSLLYSLSSSRAANITFESVIKNTKRCAHFHPTGVRTSAAAWKGFAVCYIRQYQHSY